MSRAEYSKLIDGLFEAAMLINSATGAILHVNMKGQVLFGFPPLSYASCAPVTSDHFTFWTHNMDVNTIGDVMGWSDVVQLLQHGKKAPDEWSITGTTQDGEKDFPGLAKLTYMKDYELGNGRAYIIGVFRHADDHESQSSKGGGTFGSESSTREAGMPRRRRTSFINEALFGESGVILPTTIDEQDASEQRRLSMLQSSLLSSKADNDTFTNSITDAVQRESIMTAIVEASLDPLFQINESGIIQMMNDAAITTFGYERDDLLGKNISRICGGSHAEHHNSYIQRYLATGDARIIGKRRELMAVKRDGTEFPIELAVVEVDTFLGDERLFCGFVRDLTHAKEGERITNGILESSLDAMILTDAEGLILKVNEAAISILGWSKEEFIGKDADFIIAGEEATKHERYLKQYDETGMTDIIGKRRELSALKRDGSELPIELYVVKVKGVGDMEDKYCGFLRDMSEIKEKEALVLKRERLLTSIINASVDPLFQIDENGTIRTVNPAACELFGYTDTELRGANICTIVGTEHSTSHDTNIDRDLDTGIKKIIGKRRESIARKHDGTEFAVEVSIVEVATEEGSERLFCGFITDLTEKKKLMEVQIEKTAAEVLLMNVLPEKIANQLLQDPQHIAESHKCAGIMFADICGFTEMSSKMKPKEVVSMLNELFSMFDEIVEEYALNKVKTIGDCYMVTCVPPQSDDDKTECANVCHFALDMLDALRRYNSKNTEHNLNLRIGVNIGEVVAGVVGTKRFLYDLWGDAVNTASRMESSGIPGRIQVTTDVVNLLDDIFVFEKRGPIEVKGKGTMVTYFLTERKQLPHKSLIMRREDGMLSESQAMLFDENARMTLVQTLHRLEDAMNSSSANLGDLPFEEEILVSKGAATAELPLERNS